MQQFQEQRRARERVDRADSVDGDYRSRDPEQRGCQYDDSRRRLGREPAAHGRVLCRCPQRAVSTALADAAVPNAAGNSFNQLKTIDGEAPSEIKPDLDTMVQVLTRVHDAGSDSAKQAALAAGLTQLGTAAASIGSYIGAHCK